MDSETLVQALRGAAGAKTVQCAKARHGELECLGIAKTFLIPKKYEEKVLGKTGASRRGNTRSTSGGHFY